MLRRPLRRRAAFSLVEVLVALFIVSAGLIALLSLFPLGAVQMGYAMRADRSGQCAIQADGKLRILWRQRVVENPTPADPFYTLMDDPDGAGGVPAIGATERRASYPVLLDPVGYYSYTGLKQTSAAGGNAFPRRPHPLAIGLAPSMRTAMLADDMEFAPDGTPADRDGFAVAASGQSLFRQGRYTWAVVLQRPDNSNRTTASLKVLVFDRRAPGVNPPDNEQVYTRNVTVGDTQVVFTGVSNDTLGLRAGMWIMDGTGPGTTPGIRNANFYQVKSVAEVGGDVVVELQTPILKPTGEWVPPAPPTYQAQLYIFRELIDVYDRPNLAPSGYQKQTP